MIKEVISWNHEFYEKNKTTWSREKIREERYS